MDNISHSVVGLTFAESVYQCYEKKTGDPSPLFRYSLWFLSFVANNFPDLDYAYVFLLGWQRLGALLHHRGHTHTVLFAFLQGPLLLLIFYAFSKFKKWEFSLSQWGVLLFVSAIGVWIHCGMDYLTSYGTHIFWPFDKHWSSLDSVFIVEPYFWVTFSPLLFFSSHHFLLRTIFSTLFFGILVLVWVSGMVVPEMAGVLTLWALLVAIIAARSAKTRYMHAATWMMAFIFLSVFNRASTYTNSLIRQTVEKETPGKIIHDVILTPLPSNPFCWTALVVDSLGPLTSYEISRAFVTPFPQWFDLNSCASTKMGKRYEKYGLPTTTKKELHWFGSEEFSIVRFRELAKSHCGFAAWLRYSRAPAFTEKDGNLVARDMRYDLGENNFTEVQFPIDMPYPLGGDCSLGADWIPPRQDLIVE